MLVTHHMSAASANPRLTMGLTSTEHPAYLDTHLRDMCDSSQAAKAVVAQALRSVLTRAASPPMPSQPPAGPEGHPQHHSTGGAGAPTSQPSKPDKETSPGLQSRHSAPPAAYVGLATAQEAQAAVATAAAAAARAAANLSTVPALSSQPSTGTPAEPTRPTSATPDTAPVSANAVPSTTKAPAAAPAAASAASHSNSTTLAGTLLPAPALTLVSSALLASGGHTAGGHTTSGASGGGCVTGPEAVALAQAVTASKLGLCDQLRQALDSNADLANLRDDEGRTCLHYAAGYGHEDCVDVLLTKTADAKVPDCNGDVPLHFAAIHGHPMCAYNIGKACSAACLSKNARGQTPIDVAVACERGEVLNAMLLACAGDTSEMAVRAMCKLLKDGAVPDTWAPNGSSALMLAASVDGTQALQVLLTAGASIELQDALGRSALMFAAGNCAQAALTTLLDAGACMSLRDRRGRSVLDYAPEGSQVRKTLTERMHALEAVAQQLQADLLASLEEDAPATGSGTGSKASAKGATKQDGTSKVAGSAPARATTATGTSSSTSKKSKGSGSSSVKQKGGGVSSTSNHPSHSPILGTSLTPTIEEELSGEMSKSSSQASLPAHQPGAVPVPAAAAAAKQQAERQVDGEAKEQQLAASAGSSMEDEGLAVKEGEDPGWHLVERKGGHRAPASVSSAASSRHTPTPSKGVASKSNGVGAGAATRPAAKSTTADKHAARSMLGYAVIASAGPSSHTTDTMARQGSGHSLSSLGSCDSHACSHTSSSSYPSRQSVCSSICSQQVANGHATRFGAAAAVVAGEAGQVKKPSAAAVVAGGVGAANTITATARAAAAASAAAAVNTTAAAVAVTAASPAATSTAATSTAAAPRSWANTVASASAGATAVTSPAPPAVSQPTPPAAAPAASPPASVMLSLLDTPPLCATPFAAIPPSSNDATPAGPLSPAANKQPSAGLLEAEDGADAAVDVVATQQQPTAGAADAADLEAAEPQDNSTDPSKQDNATDTPAAPRVDEQASPAQLPCDLPLTSSTSTPLPSSLGTTTTTSGTSLQPQLSASIVPSVPQPAAAYQLPSMPSAPTLPSTASSADTEQQLKARVVLLQVEKDSLYAQVKALESRLALQREEVERAAEGKLAAAVEQAVYVERLRIVMHLLSMGMTPSALVTLLSPLSTPAPASTTPPAAAAAAPSTSGAAGSVPVLGSLPTVKAPTPSKPPPATVLHDQATIAEAGEAALRATAGTKTLQPRNSGPLLPTSSSEVAAAAPAEPLAQEPAPQAFTPVAGLMQTKGLDAATAALAQPVKDSSQQASTSQTAAAPAARTAAEAAAAVRAAAAAAAAAASLADVSATGPTTKPVRTAAEAAAAHAAAMRLRRQKQQQATPAPAAFTDALFNERLSQMCMVLPPGSLPTSDWDMLPGSTQQPTLMHHDHLSSLSAAACDLPTSGFSLPAIQASTITSALLTTSLEGRSSMNDLERAPTLSVPCPATCSADTEEDLLQLDTTSMLPECGDISLALAMSDDDDDTPCLSRDGSTNQMSTVSRTRPPRPPGALSASGSSGIAAANQLPPRPRRSVDKPQQLSAGAGDALHQYHQPAHQHTASMDSNTSGMFSAGFDAEQGMFAFQTLTSAPVSIPASGPGSYNLGQGAQVAASATSAAGLYPCVAGGLTSSFDSIWGVPSHTTFHMRQRSAGAAAGATPPGTISPPPKAQAGSDKPVPTWLASAPVTAAASPNTSATKDPRGWAGMPRHANGSAARHASKRLSMDDDAQAGQFTNQVYTSLASRLQAFGHSRGTSPSPSYDTTRLTSPRSLTQGSNGSVKASGAVSPLVSVMGFNSMPSSSTKEGSSGGGSSGSAGKATRPGGLLSSSVPGRHRGSTGSLNSKASNAGAAAGATSEPEPWLAACGGLSIACNGLSLADAEVSSSMVRQSQACRSGLASPFGTSPCPSLAQPGMTAAEQVITNTAAGAAAAGAPANRTADASALINSGAPASHVTMFNADVDPLSSVRDQFIQAPAARLLAARGSHGAEDLMGARQANELHAPHHLSPCGSPPLFGMDSSAWRVAAGRQWGGGSRVGGEASAHGRPIPTKTPWNQLISAQQQQPHGMSAPTRPVGLQLPDCL